MKRLAFLLTLFTGSAIVRGQVNNFNQSPVTLQSPDATQFIRYGDIPMDYSTGVPNISIPLYNVTSGKLSLPIGMSYNASGIKVLDIAGTVGLGWSLNVGGLISRTVVGTNDQENKPKPFLSSTDVENAFNYCHNNLTLLNVQNLVETIDHIFKNSTQQKESQSDRFFYSFNGRSGIFRTDFQTGVARTVPYSALKISTGTNNAGPYTITAEDGTKYFFEQPELSGSSPGVSFYTSFYLTKIVSPDLTNSINIYYKQDAQVSQRIKNYQLVHKIIWHPAYGADPDIIETEGYNNEFLNTSIPVMPDSITSDNETVLFEYISDRPDLRLSRLIKIKILNRVTREIIKVLEFQHSYFGTAAANNRRLRLDNLHIKDNSNTTGQQYSFGYNNTPLPSYYSTIPLGMWAERHNIDYWGYYNAADDVNLLPKEMFDPVFEHPYVTYGDGYFTPQEKTLYGGNRNPNPATAQACILNEITYPTGGKTNFEYESNRVQNGYAYSSGHPIPEEYGGLRIKKITSTADAASPPVIKTYEYSTGLGTMIQSEMFQYNTPGWYFVCGDQGTTRPIHRSTISTDPLIQMSTGSGSLVLYPNVREYDGTVANNKGYTEYIYDYSSLSPYIFDPGSGGNPLQNGFYLSDYGNYQPQLKTKIIIGKDQNNIIKEIKKEEYTYSMFNTGNFITGVKIQRNNPFDKIGCGSATDAELACGNAGPGPCQLGLGNLLNYYSYSNTLGVLDVPLLTQKKETLYPSTGTGSLVTTTDYTYDLVTLQPIEEKGNNSKGETFIFLNKYPTDFSSSAPYSTMVARNILTPVIEQSAYKNSVSSPNFLKSTKTNFDFWNGASWSSSPTNIIVPRTVDTRSKDQPSYETRMCYYSYDDKGNPTTVLKENDVKKTYLWGYNKSYPVAEVTGANESDIAYTSFEADGKGNWTFNGVPIADATAPTGKKVYSLNGSNNITHTGLNSSTTYIVSYWTKNINAFTIAGTISGYPVQGRIINGWKYFEHKITGQTQITIGSNGLVDELRLYPDKALMTTYTYNPLIGMTTQCDANNKILYYEYDGFGRLILIRDQDKNIIKKVCYNYAGQTTNCNIYYNAAATQNFTRNNCPSGYTASTVSYSVPENVYVSTISQTDADAKAQADIAANGQAYANALGTCTAPACSPSNCTGVNKKCVNGICETGFKIYTSSYYDPLIGKYWCTYHYEWSDGSWSQDYNEISNTQCFLSE